VIGKMLIRSNAVQECDATKMTKELKPDNKLCWFKKLITRKKFK